MKKIIVILGLVLAFFLGLFLPGVRNQNKDQQEVVTGAEFTCSMHPQIRLTEMGQCPICFMDLIPVGEDTNTDEALLVLSDEAVHLAEIRTALVVRENRSKQTRLQGRIEYDETRVKQISAWLPGRIDRKYVDYTGIEVRKGEHLVDIYSPKLITAQEEFLQTLKSVETLGRSSLKVIRDTTIATYRDARERLLLMGLKEEQIRLLERSREISDQITIYSPSSGIVIQEHIHEGAYVNTGTPLYTIADLEGVWLVADAYESDLGWLHYGQDVVFTVQSFPGERFNGRVSFISPTVDQKTRTIKIRINVGNADKRLKPGMFANAEVQADLTEQGLVTNEDLAGSWICRMHRGIVRDQPGQCPICEMDLETAESIGLAGGVQGTIAPLLIPRGAPLITGKRALVYVRLPGTKKPTFQYRQITLGPRLEDAYVVLSGLEEGERVVTHGNFKIDSARQILGRPSMMSAPSQKPASEAGEFSTSLAKLQVSYYQVSDTLADDQSGKAAAEAMLAALEAVLPQTLADSDQSMWLNLSKTLAESLRNYAVASDIEAERERFVAISNGMVRIFDVFGAPNPAYQFHCPMAPGEDGAVWIQNKEDMFNPYMGHRMLKCGTMIGTLGDAR